MLEWNGAFALEFSPSKCASDVSVSDGVCLVKAQREACECKLWGVQITGDVLTAWLSAQVCGQL